MKKWEYGTSSYVITAAAKKAMGPEGASKNFIDWLNGLGDQGWEVVDFQRTTNNTVATLKRPKTEIAGKKVEPLRKSKGPKEGETAPLIVEMAVMNFGGSGEFGHKTAKIQVQLPEIDFKKVYDYKYQWTASMSQQAPSATVNIENARVFVESNLRKDLQEFNLNPTSFKWV